MFEYAISKGEGTLIDYGVANRIEQAFTGDMAISLEVFERPMIASKSVKQCWCPAASPYDVMFGPCDSDCLTGK